MSGYRRMVEHLRSTVLRDCVISPGSELMTRFGLISHQRAIRDSVQAKLLKFEQWKRNNPEFNPSEVVCHGCAGLGFNEDGQCPTCRGTGGISEAREEYNRQVDIALNLLLE